MYLLMLSPFPCPRAQALHPLTSLYFLTACELTLLACSLKNTVFANHETGSNLLLAF